MMFSGSAGFPRQPLCLCFFLLFCNEASCLKYKRPYFTRDRFIQRGSQQLASNAKSGCDAQWQGKQRSNEVTQEADVCWGCGNETDPPGCVCIASWCGSIYGGLKVLYEEVGFFFFFNLLLFSSFKKRLKLLEINVNVYNLVRVCFLSDVQLHMRDNSFTVFDKK